MVLTGQGTQVAPVAHGASHAGTGPCHQFGNGHAGNTGQAACVTSTGEGWVMSKCGFYWGLSSSGVAVGARAVPKAP